VPDSCLLCKRGQTTAQGGKPLNGPSLAFLFIDFTKIRHCCRRSRAFIEGGWPGSNPRDKEFFIRLQNHGSEECSATSASGGSPGTDRAAAPQKE
jgi:hypothetical protein